MPIEGSTAEKVRGVGSTVARATPGTSAQDAAGSHSADTVLGMVEKWPELADGTSVTADVWRDGLTPSDPGAAVEWLAFNAFIRQLGEQMGY